MGRRTFESLPKMLPNRHHIVLSSSNDFPSEVEVYKNLKDLLEMYKDYKGTRKTQHIFKDLTPGCLWLISVFNSSNIYSKLKGSPLESAMEGESEELVLLTLPLLTLEPKFYAGF